MVMRKTLAKLLTEAESASGWDRNSREPWIPILSFLEKELDIAGSDIHAIKVQKSSARKSLWQGRLHRSPPLRGLFLAADEPCDEKAFETLSQSVEERFHPPTMWADACFVMSGQKLIGCVEREGVGLVEWLSNGGEDVESALCESQESQLELSKLVNAGLTPEKFVKKLESITQKDERKKYLTEAFKLNPKEILVSVSAEPANAAKNRWEGSDMDPAIRYRLGIVGSDNWDWVSAAEEIMHRMDPPDLSLDFALLAAKSKPAGPWNQFRAFVREGSNSSSALVEVFESGEINQIRKISVEKQPHKLYAKKVRKEDSALRVRDMDAGDIRYEVSRPKRRVHDFLTNVLSEWAKQQKLMIREGSTPIAMYDALVEGVDEVDLLIEVKTSAEPGVVRLAVGQLLDYRRILVRDGGVKKCEGILLLPSTENLSSEMLDLLKMMGFSWAKLKYQDKNKGAKLILEIHRSDGTVQKIP